MAAGVPPPPLNSPTGSYYWLEWYTNLTNFLNGTNIPWSNLNFSNSDIADIQHRNHNELTMIQGGNASGTTPGTGNAWHMLGQQFIGSVNAAGAAIQLPAGWTIASTGSTYTVTHGLGLTVTAYTVNVQVNGSTAGWSAVTQNANTFVVVLNVAAPWSFVLNQGS